MRATMLAMLLISLIVPALPQDSITDDEAQRLAREYAEAKREYDLTGIATSLDDATTDIAFLDGFTPMEYAPLGEMPRLPGRGYLLLTTCSCARARPCDPEPRACRNRQAAVVQGQGQPSIVGWGQ
ncbi:MAG: hypothetical protein GF320_13285 [Armatimonadia bacterium]|nr:hypothetical protein [Armatimonadia bacterium]